MCVGKSSNLYICPLEVPSSPFLSSAQRSIHPHASHPSWSFVAIKARPTRATMTAINLKPALNTMVEKQRAGSWFEWVSSQVKRVSDLPRLPFTAPDLALAPDSASTRNRPINDDVYGSRTSSSPQSITSIESRPRAPHTRVPATTASTPTQERRQSTTLLAFHSTTSL